MRDTGQGREGHGHATQRGHGRWPASDRAAGGHPRRADRIPGHARARGLAHRAHVTAACLRPGAGCGPRPYRLGGLHRGSPGSGFCGCQRRRPCRPPRKPGSAVVPLWWGLQRPKCRPRVLHAHTAWSFTGRSCTCLSSARRGAHHAALGSGSSHRPLPSDAHTGRFVHQPNVEANRAALQRLPRPQSPNRTADPRRRRQQPDSQRTEQA